MLSVKTHLVLPGLLLAGTTAFLQHRSRPLDEIPGLQTAPGLEATLFAESPVLTNPTNIDIDSRGRVWVVEGYNYRSQMHPENPVRAEGDRIVILEDTNGDGRADEHKVFYQGRDIDAAMGITVLGNRVIVSAYENVFVFTDRDGDDRADDKEVLFRFSEKNHDHTVHAFVFGPDGRLYFNMGNEGDVVKDAQGNVIVDRAGNRVTEEGKPYREGMVFRVEPDGSGFEVLGHNFRNPYEVALDSYGTLWQSDNDDDGNRGVRINYVMEYGNFGYKDEMTGASWPAHRTGMEEEVPLRHWHLNDPGVVPNVLQTGAGSPSGITVYEGKLLPERFHGTMIHAEAGQNVVRAYPVQPQGAGYRGEIVDVLKAVGDPNFRPVDVAVAPDGSLFVADWYDPGVGGHNVADQGRGRIIRIAPPGAPYRVSRPDLSSPAAAVEALQSPDLATRYLAHTQLKESGRRAERALQQLWRSDDPRMRARALWLLAGTPGRGQRYVDAALKDADPQIRITGLRAARRIGADVLPLARRLVRDPSPQVRREVALALRHDTRPEVARLWTELALQHDGQDRWYLEALGIAADRQWDRFFGEWKQAVGEGWRSTPAGRDIVWRARTDAALPLLAELIRDAETDRTERLRYFRAFDFHRGDARQPVLLALLQGSHPDQDQLTALALAHLDAEAAASSPQVAGALRRTLDAARGTREFVELVRRYDVRERADELVGMAMERPESSEGVEAARLAMRWQGVDPFRQAIDGGDPAAASRALAALARAGGRDADRLLEEVALDASRPLALRLTALRQWGPGWNAQGRLAQLVEEGKLPEELKPIAAQIMFNSYRPNVRAAAEKHLERPDATTASGAPLPAIAVLAQRTGSAARGADVYARVCASCHVAGNTGSEFGPGLSEIGDKLSKEALYTSILHPSAGISFGYEGYVLRLRDGSEAVGIIGSETEDEVVLRHPGGISARHRKSDIAGRSALDVSLMPDGLEAAMTEDALVDLVEYLSTLRRAATR